jgi:hypothetical protein
MWSNSKAYQEANRSKYWGSKKTMKKRAARNTARNRMIAEWKASKGDWKQVDHVKPLSKWWTNDRSNLRVISAKKNMQWWAKIVNSMKNRKKNYAKRIK